VAPNPRAVEVTGEIYDYLVGHSSPPDPIYDAIRADTIAEAGDWAGMQIGPDQFRFLQLLVSVVGASLAVEVGTFTGTSAAAVAPALRAGGRVICCDISEEWTSIARRHWEAAGLTGRIDLRIAPALETLTALPADPPVDFAFIDADKEGYVDYYEALVPLLRPGGVLVADNVLWRGQVVDASVTDASTEALRRFNDHVTADDRVTNVMVAVGDGLMICHKH
jgi:caffeoyl-CoA O-methyltransferase